MKTRQVAQGRRLAAVMLVALLGACGGGGDGGGDVPAHVVVPLAAALANYVDQSLSVGVSIDGTATAAGQTLPITGSGTYSESTSSATFEGQPALRKDTTLTGMLTVAAVSVPLSSSGQSWFDAERRPLAATSAESYCVRTSVQPLPASAAAGANGAWYTMDCYASSARLVRVASVAASYVVEPDSGSTALVKLLTLTTEAGGASFPVTTTFRVTTAGAVTRVRETAATTIEGVALSMTITYQ